MLTKNKKSGENIRPLYQRAYKTKQKILAFWYLTWRGKNNSQHTPFIGVIGYKR